MKDIEELDIIEVDDDDDFFFYENVNISSLDKDRTKKHRSFSVDDSNGGKQKGRDTKRIKRSARRKRKRDDRLTRKVVISRIAISIGTFLVLVLVFLYGVIRILEFGPSVTARNLFVNSALESSAGGFMATWFFSEEELEEITNVNSVEEVADVTDTSLVTVVTTTSTDEDTDEADIEIIDIDGKSFHGKLMIVKDPSRVSVGICNQTYDGSAGKTVAQIAQMYNAIAAINAGGFQDDNGVGNGGTPIGIVISDGTLKYGSLDTTYEVIGFDSNNILVVGKMTAQQALDRGIRDAVSFGPTLIVNGEAAIVNGSGSGINPRTAIGQTATGEVLLLVLDGRQINSIGATYSDVIDVMLQYGAVNAANLDGGTSSVMYYDGEYINNTSAIYGSRNLPTTFVVQ